MTYKTHTIAGMLAGLLVMLFTHIKDPWLLLFAFIGSLLPDIDHPESYLSNRQKRISNFITKRFKHRGPVHSLLGMGIISSPTFAMRWEAGLFLALGFFSHLAFDYFNPAGVAWFWPKEKEPKKFPISRFRIEVRSDEEYMLMYFLGGILLMLPVLLQENSLIFWTIVIIALLILR